MNEFRYLCIISFKEDVNSVRQQEPQGPLAHLSKNSINSYKISFRVKLENKN